MDYCFVKGEVSVILTIIITMIRYSASVFNHKRYTKVLWEMLIPCHSELRMVCSYLIAHVEEPT